MILKNVVAFCLLDNLVQDVQIVDSLFSVIIDESTDVASEILCDNDKVLL